MFRVWLVPQQTLIPSPSTSGHSYSLQVEGSVGSPSSIFQYRPMLFHVLTTSKIISGRVPTCDVIMLPHWKTRPTAPRPGIPPSHYPDNESTSHCPILIMTSTWLGSNKYQFLNHWFDLTRVQTHAVQIPRSPKTRDGCSPHSAILSGHIGRHALWPNWYSSCHTFAPNVECSDIILANTFSRNKTWLPVYNKTSLNRPTMKPTLNGSFGQVVNLGS